MRDLGWALAHLWTAGSDKVSLNVPDTLVLEGGRVKLWLFTSKSGVFLKKSERTVGASPLDKALSQFRAAASALGDSGQTAALLFCGGKRQRVSGEHLDTLDAAALRAREARLLMQALPGAELCVKYSLDSNGVTFTSQMEPAVESLARDADRVVALLAKHINAGCSDKIVKMKVKFTHHKDALWLTDVRVGQLLRGGCASPAARARAPAAADAARAAKASSPLRSAARSRSRSRSPAARSPARRSPAPAPATAPRAALLSPSIKTRRCVGEFCGYDPERERRWQSMSELEAAGAGSSDLLLEAAALETCAYNAVVPESMLVKLPYRSVALAHETVDKMDPLLAGWTRRRLAQRNKIRALSHVEVSAQGHARWQWSGQIPYVDLCVGAPGEPGRVVQRSARNTGAADIKVPPGGPWELRVSDSSDAQLVAVSEPFSAGAAAPASRQTRESFEAFREAHSLANYHRTAKVCPSCAAVYRSLDALRLEEGRDALKPQRPRQCAGGKGAEPGELHLPRLAAHGAQHAHAAEPAPQALQAPQARRRTNQHDSGAPAAGAGAGAGGAASGAARRARQAQAPTHGRSQGEVHQQPRGRQRLTKTSEPRRGARARARVRGKNEAHTDTDEEEPEEQHSFSAQDAAQQLQQQQQQQQQQQPSGDPGKVPLAVAHVQQGSGLHQVLCLLALGQLEDCRMMIRLVDAKGLAALAFSKVQDGRIVVQGDVPLAPKEAAKRPGRTPSFLELLGRTLRGRQTLALLAEHLAVCHTFVHALEPQAGEAKRARTRRSLVERRASDAMQALERFAEVHKVAQPRLELLRGLHAVLLGAADDAAEHWRAAIAAAARIEGMWSYNVGVAHLLLGKHAPAARSPSSEQQSHLAAAAAIFSRLDAARELALAARLQSPRPRTAGSFFEHGHGQAARCCDQHDRAERSGRHQPAAKRSGNAPKKQHQQQHHSQQQQRVGAELELGRPQPEVEGKAAAVAQPKAPALAAAAAAAAAAAIALAGARETLHDITRRLERKRLLPRNLPDPGPLREGALQVQRALEAAENDMEILQGTAPGHKHVAHRLARVGETSALARLALERLEALDAGADAPTRGGSGRSTSMAESGEPERRTADSSKRSGSFCTDAASVDDLDCDADVEEDVRSESDCESACESKEQEREREQEQEEAAQAAQAAQAHASAPRVSAPGPLEGATDELFEACHSKHLVRMKRLLAQWTAQHGRAAGEALDNQANTLLHVAAFSNWIAGIHTCLRFAIDVNARNIEGNTPLHLARERGNDTAETLLVALGADVSIKNIYGLGYEEGSRFGAGGAPSLRAPAPAPTSHAPPSRE
jgi:hypothetical protein